MSPESVATISASLVDLDATFLPIAQMRQITRVTALDGLHIAAEVALGASIGCTLSTSLRTPSFQAR